MKTSTRTRSAALARPTRRYTRLLAGLTATVALAAPLAGSALEQTPIDACINAFVATTLPSEQPVRIRKDTITQSPVDASGRTYLISMTATGATSGKRYGKATCRVTRAGQVIALNGRPLPVYADQSAPSVAEQTASR